MSANRESAIKHTHLRVRLGNTIRRDRVEQKVEDSASEALAHELESMDGKEWASMVEELMNLPVEQKKAKLGDLSRAFEKMGSGLGSANTLLTIQLLRGSLPKDSLSTFE